MLRGSYLTKRERIKNMLKNIDVNNATFVNLMGSIFGYLNLTQFDIRYVNYNTHSIYKNRYDNFIYFFGSFINSYVLNKTITVGKQTTKWISPYTLFLDLYKSNWSDTKKLLSLITSKENFFDSKDYFRRYNNSFVLILSDTEHESYSISDLENYEQSKLSHALFYAIEKLIEERIHNANSIQKQIKEDESKRDKLTDYIREMENTIGLDSLVITDSDFMDLASHLDYVYNSLLNYKEIFIKCVENIVENHKDFINKKTLEEATREELERIREEREFEYAEEYQIMNYFNHFVMFEDNKKFVLSFGLNVILSLFIIYVNSYEEEDVEEDFDPEIESIVGGSMEVYIRFIYNKENKKAFIQITNRENNQIKEIEI